MEFPLNNCNAESDIQVAEFPLIRQFGVPYHFAQSPQTDVEGQWQVCNPQTAPGFTAVGFYFARKVQQQTGVPIGILRSCVGGTNIECWMCQETLLGTPELAPFAQIMRDSLAQYQNELATALPEIEAWAARSRAALNSQTDIPLPPVWPEFPFGEKRFRPRCVTLHNGMIAPLVPMALKGILWYQGESNAGNAFDCEQYIVKQRTMVADWRRWFRNEELPFYFVQLATFQQPTDDPIQVDSWALFREAQRKCLEIPNSGMAVIYDLGDANDIHPQNKYDVGERLARWALSNQYGKELETSGPLFRELKIEGATARLAFEHVGSGLMVGKKNGRENTVEDKDNSLKRFAIAGEDRQWHWAAAKIEGDFIVCSSAEVQKPVAIRYAFSTNPEGANLYNRDGLPGSPFRTDDW